MPLIDIYAKTQKQYNELMYTLLLLGKNKRDRFIKMQLTEIEERGEISLPILIKFAKDIKCHFLITNFNLYKTPVGKKLEKTLKAEFADEEVDKKIELIRFDISKTLHIRYLFDNEKKQLKQLQNESMIEKCEKLETDPQYKQAIQDEIKKFHKNGNN